MRTHLITHFSIVGGGSVSGHPRRFVPSTIDGAVVDAALDDRCPQLQGWVDEKEAKTQMGWCVDVRERGEREDVREVRVQSVRGMTAWMRMPIAIASAFCFRIYQYIGNIPHADVQSLTLRHTAPPSRTRITCFLTLMTCGASSMRGALPLAASLSLCLKLTPNSVMNDVIGDNVPGKKR